LLGSEILIRKWGCDSLFTCRKPGRQAGGQEINLVVRPRETLRIRGREKNQIDGQSKKRNTQKRIQQKGELSKTSCTFLLKHYHPPPKTKLPAPLVAANARDSGSEVPGKELRSWRPSRRTSGTIVGKKKRHRKGRRRKVFREKGEEKYK